MQPVLTRRKDALDELVSRARRQIAGVQGGRKPAIVAVHLAVETVDPLSVFRAAGATERRYWERPSSDFAVVGVGRLGSPKAESVSHVGESGMSLRTLALGALPFDRIRSTDRTWSDLDRFTLTLPEVTLRRERGRCVLTLAAEIDDAAGSVDVFHDLHARAEQLMRVSGEPDPLPNLRSESPDNIDGWRSTIGSAMDAIRDGSLRKVVLARRKDLQFESDLEPADVVDNLRSAYPETAIFAVSDGKSCFLGASPETLAEIHDGRVRVMCLAGTAPRGTTEAEDYRLAENLRADDKNLREHMAVVDDVVALLAPFCEELTYSGQPAVMTVRNLHHLATEVTAKLGDQSLSVTDIAQALSPTPAVAGTPTEAALSFIRHNEAFDRGLYAGAMGWMDSQGNGELVLALRSGLLRGPFAYLFAGCGIVEGSDPDREWEETELKLKPLQAALGLS